MKGIGKAILYFILYFGLTMIFQVLLSIGFMAIGTANGLREETMIMEFVNSNILGITVVSGILTAIVLYLVFKVRKKQVTIGLTGISMEDHKEELPVPSDQEAAIEKVRQDTEVADFSKGILTYVDVDFSEYRKKVDNKTVRRRQRVS